MIPKEKRKTTGKKGENKNKPELIAKEYKGTNKEKFDMEILVAKFDVDEDINFIYPKEYENKKDYVFRYYIFKNIGKTAIESLYIISNRKCDISIFNFEFAEKFMKDGHINYSCMWDKKIFPNDDLKVRMCFHKKWIATSNISCAFLYNLVTRMEIAGNSHFLKKDAIYIRQ